MLIDSHTHSFFSPDGRQTVAQLADAAAAAGLSGFTLTDHCDMQGWGIDHTPYDLHRDESYEQILAARQRHPELNIGWGAELSDWLYDPPQAAQFLTDSRLDFVIGSMHTLRGHDFYDIRYTSEEQCAGLLHSYAEDLARHCRRGNFDTLGHLTYPLRYMRRAGFHPDFTACRDEIAEVFRILISRGISLEINSSGLRQGLGCTLPDGYWLRLYRDLGGEMLTLGSDAHIDRDVGAGLQDTAALAKSVGFRYNCVYRGRKPSMLPL